VHSYSTAGLMRYRRATDPVYAPNSKGGPLADTARYGEPAGWHTGGDMVRTAYTLAPRTTTGARPALWSAT
jgi:catalase